MRLQLSLVAMLALGATACSGPAGQGVVEHDDGAAGPAALAEFRDGLATGAHVAVIVQLADAEAIQRIEADDIRVIMMDGIRQLALPAR